MQCKVCSFDNIKLYCTVNGYDILKCPRCGFGQVKITAVGLALLYDEGYWSGSTTANWSQNEDQRIDSAHIYWLNKQLHLCSESSKPISILEIGPGLGGMIAVHLAERQPAVHYEAIEISDYAAGRLSARGFTVYHGSVSSPDIVDACRGRFDLIIGTEVIEHDPDPHGFVQAIHAMLKPGGWCAFTTGNIDGLVSRWKREKWYYLDPPLHVSYFTPKAFKILFRREAFDCPSVQRQGFNYISLKLRTHIPGILLFSDLLGLSTGMTVQARRER